MINDQSKADFNHCKFTKKRDGRRIVEFYENEKDIGKKSKVLVTLSFGNQESFDQFCVWLISQK